MNSVLIIYISMVAPLLLLLVMLKKEMREIFAFYILGATICYICGEVDGFILNLSGIDQYEMTINVTPFIEETLKLLPLLYYAFVIKPKDTSIFKAGISIGVGFAVLETAVACVNSIDVATVSWALVRGLGAGLLHSLCGLGMAFGLYNMKLLKGASFAVLLGTFATLILFHSSYNILVQSFSTYLGLMLTLFVYAILILMYALFLKKKVTKHE